MFARVSFSGDVRDDGWLLMPAMRLEGRDDAADLTDSGTPSHFELTFGTVGGSFWLETVLTATGVLVLAAVCVCFRCTSASWSSAFWDGSLRVRKLRTALFFFVDDGALDSRDVEPSEDARLVDREEVELRESGKVGVWGGVGRFEARELDVAVGRFECPGASELLAVGRFESPGASELVAVLREPGRRERSCSGGRGLRYVSFGILSGRGGSAG